MTLNKNPSKTSKIFQSNSHDLQYCKSDIVWIYCQLKFNFKFVFFPD